jgi:Contact-dependent growth inhibition CdiA C-terminal domain
MRDFELPPPGGRENSVIRARAASAPDSEGMTAKDGHERTDHRQPAATRAEWQEPLARGEVDRVGDGIVDERARQFMPRERRLADYLAKTDHVAVVAFPEDHRSRDRQHDADIDGRPVEFKSPDAEADHATVKNILRKAIGQAPEVVIDGRDTGLSHHDAERGLRRYLGTPWNRKIETIRIVGDDFDMTWKREDSHGPDS